MARISIAIFGGVLILFGIINPWVTLQLYRVHKFDIPLSNEDFRVSTRTYAKLSPFTFSYYIIHIQSGTITLYGNKYFYDPLSTAIGLSCIIGAFLGAFGSTLNQVKVTRIGGFLTIISAFSFFLVLPNNISRSDYSIMKAWYFTIFGSIIIMFSSLIRTIYRYFQKNRERKNLYKKWPTYNFCLRL